MVQGVAIDHLESLQKIRDAKSFLNKEFLTWLWYTIEDTGGDFSVEIDGERTNCELWIDDKIVLEAHGSDVHKQSLKGGTPSSSLEATTALNMGKIVSELKLGLHIEDRDYSFTIGHKDLTPKSIALPKIVATGDDANYRIVHRIQALNKLIGFIDGMFMQFVRARTEKTWEDTELDSIRDWIIHRGQGEITFH